MLVDYDGFLQAIKDYGYESKETMDTIFSLAMAKNSAFAGEVTKTPYIVVSDQAIFTATMDPELAAAALIEVNGAQSTFAALPFVEYVKKHGC